MIRKEDLFPNDLIEYEESEQTIRILWINPLKTTAAIIDVGDKKALPEFVELPSIVEDLTAHVARLTNEDPYTVLVASEEKIPKKHRERRDRAWEVIKELVANEPAIYAANRRWSLIKVCMAEHGLTQRSIYIYLRRYWQRGKTPNALLPDYANCGAPGKSRACNPDIKRGRPVVYGSSQGVNITAHIREVFQIGTRRYYEGNNKNSITGAYKKIIETFFCEKDVDPETGCIQHIPIERMNQDGFPSLEQYRYWLGKDFKKLEIKRRRVGPKIYDKDMRALLGTATANVLGPGSRYEIDATIADVYLVSRLDRYRIVGRPVLYVVIDVFSRMIVGIYVGFEGPSWVSAMMALANTVADKVAFCKRFGLIIEDADWPCHHLPGALLGDRGEIESSKINALSHNFGVMIENTAAYRADWKGIVEQRFKLIPAQFKAFVPGYIQCDYRARGGKDYRLDAVLDIDEFTQIILEYVLHYNNHHEIKKYDKDRDVFADGVPPIPTELWEWGITNRSGALRAFPEDLVKFSLLPTGMATVTPFGIRFRGSFYSCPRAIEECWFDRARQEGSWKVPAGYDGRALDTIYLHHEHNPKAFDVCRLTDRSRAHQGLSVWEVEQQNQLDKHASADRRQDQLLAGIDAAANVERVVEDAKRKQGAPSTASAASRTREIRKNRAEEKAARRPEETFRFDHPEHSSGKPAEVVPFPGTGAPDYSTPDITELMDSGEDDDA